MGLKTKDLKDIEARLRSLMAKGVLEPEQMQDAERWMLRLKHALQMRDWKRVGIAISALAKIVLRCLN